MMHINGVTELNSIDVYTTPWWATLVMFLSVILCVICVITLANLNSPRRGTILVLGISIIVLVLIIGVLGLTHSFGWMDEYSYTKYEIIVDDTVNVNEFNNTYDTIEKRGQIYVVKFKEP